MSSYYSDPTVIVWLATKHQKGRLLAPAFAQVGVKCEEIAVDTDQFGTFAGEVERVGSIRQTLRAKIRTARALRPDGRLFLASEGSFGPHPLFGFSSTGLESLLFYDRDGDFEIYAEFLDESPCHEARAIGDWRELDEFLNRIGFPEQGVIVHPEGGIRPIFKGLHDRPAVDQAVEACGLKFNPVVVATDLRAMHSPRRRQAITQAAARLVEKLNSFCPKCGIPGFAPVSGVPGLRCSACGEATLVAQSVLWQCVKCPHEEIRPRADGVTTADPADCEHCNP